MPRPTLPRSLNQQARPRQRQHQHQGQSLGLLATGHPTARVVVGLGNEGSSYARTRHNIGARVVRQVARELGLRELPGLIPVPLSRAGLVLPEGFMNESGRTVRRAVQRWRPPAHGLLVVHDDLDLPFAEVQLKEGGGHGGHNGLRDIVQAIGTGAFSRLRLGIGRPPGRMDPADFVLAPFRVDEEEAIRTACETAVAQVLAFLRPEQKSPEL